MKKLALISSALVIAIGAWAQDRTCGSDLMNELSFHIDDKWLEHEGLEAFTKQFDANQITGGVKIIPTVIHVIHDYSGSNITKAQVEDAIRVINEDFRKLASDTSDVISAFKGIHADNEIEFRLAQIDPSGNCTDGITRTATDLTHGAGENVKDLISWNTSMYMNVWVVQSIGIGAGGYAYYPGNAPSASHEGIVVRNDQFGSIGTSGGSNFATRTLTHEIGHYLNLRHVWGNSNGVNEPGNCSTDDAVGDTPNTMGSNQTCNLSQNTCSSLDNVQNYMDYATCTKMFSEGQKIRMHAALNSSAGARNNLWTAVNLVATGTNDGFSQVCAPIADFKSQFTKHCAGDVITFSDISYNATVDSTWNWNWSFPGAIPSTSTFQNPGVIYSNPGTYSVTLSVSNSTGADAITKTSYVTIGAISGGRTAPLIEGIESVDFPLVPSDPVKDWVIKSTSNPTWHRNTAGSSSGNASMRIMGSGIPDSSMNSFISPTIDMSNIQSGDATLTFKLAYAKRNAGNNDMLRVWASVNCGQSWQLRYAKIGDDLATNGGGNVGGSFIPGSSQWREESANLSNFAESPNLLLKFEATSGGGNYMYIDDINIGNYIIGEEELAAKSFYLNVYPNPSSALFQVEFDPLPSEALIEVINPLGQMVHNSVIGKSSTRSFLSLREMPTGFYTLRLHIADLIVQKKLIRN